MATGAPAETHIDLGGNISPVQDFSSETQDGDDSVPSNWFPSAHQLLLGGGGAKDSALTAIANNKNVGVAKAWLSDRHRGMKSWREFAKTDKFHFPHGPAVVGKRIVRNVEYFQSNYAAVFIVLTVYCILTSPLLLLALVASSGMFFYIRSRGHSIKLAGRAVGPAQQYMLAAVFSLPLFYVAGAGAVLFWVIGASIFVIVLHAALYASEPVPGAEFITEDV